MRAGRKPQGLFSVYGDVGRLEDEVTGGGNRLEVVHKDISAEAMGFAISAGLRVIEDGVVVWVVAQVELLQEKDEVGVGGDGLRGVDVDGVASAP